MMVVVLYIVTCFIFLIAEKQPTMIVPINNKLLNSRNRFGDISPKKKGPFSIVHRRRYKARMDSPSSSLDQNLDLSKLSDKDKQELQQFIVNESQKARIQQC